MNKSIQHLCIGSLSVSLLGCNQTPPSVQTDFERPIQVIELASSQSSATKHFNGTVQSQHKAGLSFRVPGTIEEILVKQGDNVTHGQVLARLDHHDYQVTLEELKARHLEAESAFRLAQAELARVKQATADDAIASVNLDRAVSGYERALSAVKVVDKNIQRAQDTLRYTELKAPFDGVIGSVNFDAFEQILPHVSVIDLQDNQKLEVTIDVPETMINDFSLGQSSEVSWYQSDKTLAATVSEITTFPHIIKQTYGVTFTIDEPSQSLLPGRSVTVSSQLGDNTNSAYCLPYSALIGERDALHVNLVRNNTIVKQSVEMRSLNAYQACVDSTFMQGDYVVISGAPYVQDGDVVNNLIVKTL